MKAQLAKKWKAFAAKGCPECGGPLLYGGMTRFFEYTLIAQDSGEPGDIKTGKDSSDGWNLCCAHSDHDAVVEQAFRSTFTEAQRDEILDYIEENKS